MAIENEYLSDLAKDCESTEKTRFLLVEKSVLLELVRAYQYHKRVLPLHTAIHEACKAMGM